MNPPQDKMNKKELKQNIEWYFPDIKIQNKQIQKQLIKHLKDTFK